MTSAGAVETAADLLGLRIVHRFEGSMFGAVLVEGRGDEPLVLKATLDLGLADAWATGATMAARLRARGYPASDYVETGTTDDVLWSLQVVLPGRVPKMFTLGHAEQLIALACRHNIDAGVQRPWDELAREVTWRALTEVGPLPDGFDGTLRAMLVDTEDLVLSRTTIVHEDFHHRNFLVEDDRITGVFDWDIAGAGEWRFDLVGLAWACQMYPKTCEPEALAAVIAAVHEHCDPPTAAFLMACQTLRGLNQVRRGQPDSLEPVSRWMEKQLVQWWI